MAASFSRPSHLKCPFSSVFSRTKSPSQKSFSASFDTDDQHRPSALLVRRYSISAAATAGLQDPERLRAAEVVVDLRLLRRRRPAPAEGPLVRRYSISAAAAASASSPPSQLPLASKVQRLADNVQLARQDYLELRQEASELQEYSNTKLNRVTRYLGVLADKSLLRTHGSMLNALAY